MPIPDPYPKKWPKAFLFDWDNTLADTWRVCYEALTHTCQNFKVPTQTHEEFFNQPHLSIKDSFPQRFGADAIAAEVYFYERLRKSNLDSLRPLPGAEKLLQLLAGRNVYVAVVSNKQGDCLREEVHHLGWSHYFGKIIGSRDTPEDKPSAVPLIAALESTHIAPGHEVWFAGDSHVDTLCATNANCVPVAMSPDAAVEGIPVILGTECLGVHNILTRL